MTNRPLSEAFFCRQPDENHAAFYRFLLERSARMYGVHFALDRTGDAYLTGRLPLSAVTEAEIDRPAAMRDTPALIKAYLRLGGFVGEGAFIGLCGWLLALPISGLLVKTLLTGVGLALKTWDEVEDLAKELVDKGKMTEKDGSKFLKDLQNRYEETQKKLEARVEKTVKDFLKKADVVTGDELKAVKKEIRELKKMISSQKEKS